MTGAAPADQQPGPRRGRVVGSTRPFQVLRPSGPFAELDRHRAWRPAVLRGDGSRLRMWYGGHDGTINRVLTAEQWPREGWVRRGVSLDAGLAGASDGAGADAPSVARTPSGFVMAYAGSDGSATRIHLAASTDGDRWRSSGPLPVAGDDVATESPCLLVLGDQLWLYYASSLDDGRTAVVAARSSDGATWRTVGPVLGPRPGDLGVFEPWVVERDDDLLMFFVRRHDDQSTSVELATSPDGRAWTWYPVPLDLLRRHHDAGVISGPSALQHKGGRINVWYAAGDEGDTRDGCRLWSAELTGRVR